MLEPLINNDSMLARQRADPGIKRSWLGGILALASPPENLYLGFATRPRGSKRDNGIYPGHKI